MPRPLLVFDWLSANKLFLNITKTNFSLLHPPQWVPNYKIKLQVKDKQVKQEKYIKYL